MRSFIAPTVLALLLATSSCGKQEAPAEAGAEAKPRVEGQVEWAFGGAERSLTIDGCRSGQWRDFFGVILTSSSEPQFELRLRRDPITEEGSLRLDTGGEGFVLRSSDAACSVFEAVVENTGSYSHSYVRVRRGRLEVSCREPEGARLAAKISFAGCE